MAPTLSLSLGFREREENPSILAAGQDDFDFGDDWNDQDKRSASHWRNSCPDKRSIASTSRWSSRLTSLSSSVIGAGTALTTRAKQLNVGGSTQRAISQLRKTIVEVSTRTESSLRASMPAQHRFSEADIDQFADIVEQPESEKDGCDEDTDDEGDLGCRFKRFHLSKSWTQGNRSETQTTDATSLGGDQDKTKQKGIPVPLSQAKKPKMQPRLQEFEAARHLQLEDIDVTDTGHYTEHSPAASNTGSNSCKLTEWLNEFEAHLINMKEKGNITSNDMVTTDTAPRLGAWLADFEAKRQET